MESNFTSEYMGLIGELSLGMEQAKQLRLHLYLTSPCEVQDLILQRILSSYEKSLVILKSSGTAGQLEVTSSVCADGISPSEDLNNNFLNHQEHTDAPKKRKLLHTQTELVRVNSENGLEGPPNDGYNWRKYGQKDILGAKYPRSYYRCTYRSLKNYWATKQVQRSDNDSTTFEITYKRTHTCNHSANAVPHLASPGNQDLRNNPNNHQPQHDQMLLNFQTDHTVVTEDLENKKKPKPNFFSYPFTSALLEGQNNALPTSMLVDHNQFGSYSQLISESSYLPYQTNIFESTHNLQYSDSDTAVTISANGSTSNSPIGSIEFPVESFDLDPNFPLNTSEVLYDASRFRCNVS